MILWPLESKRKLFRLTEKNNREKAIKLRGQYQRIFQYNNKFFRQVKYLLVSSHRHRFLFDKDELLINKDKNLQHFLFLHNNFIIDHFCYRQDVQCMFIMSVEYRKKICWRKLLVGFLFYFLTNNQCSLTINFVIRTKQRIKITESLLVLS